MSCKRGDKNIDVTLYAKVNNLDLGLVWENFPEGVSLSVLKDK